MESYGICRTPERSLGFLWLKVLVSVQSVPTGVSQGMRGSWLALLLQLGVRGSLSHLVVMAQAVGFI